MAGTYDGAGSGTMELMLDKKDGTIAGKVAANTDSGNYTADLKDIKFDGAKMSAKYDFPLDPSAEVVVTATFDGNNAKGTWSLRRKGQTGPARRRWHRDREEVSDGARHFLQRRAVGADRRLLARGAGRPQISVSGTTATDSDGSIVGPGDAYAQAMQALPTSRRRSEGGAQRQRRRPHAHVRHQHRTDWEAVGRAHGEVFGAIRPATTMVEVSALIDPAILVEIEADAIVSD